MDARTSTVDAGDGMKTIGWAMTLVMAAGCTGNSISLDRDDDAGTDGSSGPATTDTWPTTSVGSDESSDDGPVECYSDSDCNVDFCAWCNDGVCQQDAGCCSAVPEEPSVWRCQPPVECWDDTECPDGEVCSNLGECVPDPTGGLRQPPMCDDLVLEIEQVPLVLSLQQLAVYPGGPMEPGILLGVDAEQQLWQVAPISGALLSVAPLPGAIVDLHPAGPSIAAVTLADGGQAYQVSRLHRVDEAWELQEGPVTPGSVVGGAWLGDAAAVATVQQVDRWALEPAPARLGGLPLPSVLALTGARITADGPLQLAVGDAFGTVGLRDAVTGDALIDPIGLPIAPLQLAGLRDDGVGDAEGRHLMVLSALALGDTGESITHLQVVRDLQQPQLDEAFGGPGQPLSMVAVDVDDDAVQDVVVATAGGRLDVYRMHEVDVLCRAFVPLGSEITDMTLGDVDGDGALDVVVGESAGWITIIRGRPTTGR